MLCLLRRAQIPAEFKLLPNDSNFSTTFNFRPTEGILEVGEAKTIKVQLQSDLLGDFTDTFQWALTGSPKIMNLQFKGAIIGPKFEVTRVHSCNTFECTLLASIVCKSTNTA